MAEEGGRVKKEEYIPASAVSEGCLLISIFTGTAWRFLWKKKWHVKGSVSIMDYSGRQLQKLFLSKKHNLLVCVSGFQQASVKTGLKQLLLMSATTVKPGFQTDILIYWRKYQSGF